MKNSPDTATLLRAGSKSFLGKTHGGPPRYTIAEFAAATRADVKKMRRLIGANGPKPEMAHTSTGSPGAAGYRNYYRLDELKAWWVALPAETKDKIRVKA